MGGSASTNNVREKPVENKKIVNIEFKENEIQNHISKDPKVPSYNKLFQFESDLLKKKIFEGKKEARNYNIILEEGNLQFDLNDICINNNRNNNVNLKEKIILNEESYLVMGKKIIDEINKIKNNNEQHEIKHLTILLVGKNGIGKTTLVNYIFGLDKENKSEHKILKRTNFEIHSKENFPIKIIEFKGIGYDKNNSIETIAQEAFDCIKEQKENQDYNDFVHCIWYLISGVRFIDIEKDFLEKLMGVYKEDKNIPIIMVYNQFSQESSTRMKKHLNDNFGQLNFVEISPVDNKVIKSNKSKSSFGGEGLIKETLLKVSNALKGDLIGLMTDIIRKSAKEKMLQINKEIEEDINTNVDNKIKEFKTVFSDEELKNYVVNLFENYIYHFYKGYNNKISNESSNLLKQSSIIKSIDNFIKYYKPEYEKIIKSKLDEIANTLINEQAIIEKKYDNMRIEFKRNIKKFKETTTVYFKRNYYYISQKYILEEISQVLKIFIICYRENLDDIVNEILMNRDNNNDNNNISLSLQNCFLEKLKNFAIKNKVNIDIKPKVIRNIENNDDNNRDIINEPPPIRARSNSIDIINNFNIEPNDYNIINEQRRQPEEQNWFIYRDKKKNWKCLNNQAKASLQNFLENNIIYQEKYFEHLDKENDAIFKMLKVYEKNELVKFFNKYYKYFMKKYIFDVYNSKYILVYRKEISTLINNKIFEEIYLKKLDNIAKKINSDFDFCKIKHLTIVVIGRCGVGKSTLINSVLKEEKAPTDTGNIVTLENTLYGSEIIPFLKLYDTRGIQLNNEFGPKIILENALNIIKNSEKEKDFNNYVNCIWYCVSDLYIDDREIDIIKSLKQQKKNIPLIIVYSYAIIEKGFKNVQSKIKNEFPDAIFIPVLAKKSDDVNPFGLDELLEKTLELCKKVIIHGKIFNSMKEKISKYILDSFKKEHKALKDKINCEISNEFVNNFTKVLNEEQLKNYNYNKIKSLFIEFLKIDNLFEKKELNLEKSDIIQFNDFPEKFINNYKNKTKKLIESINGKMALDFIDRQVYFEKTKEKNISKENKNDFNGFIQIINNYLKDNFYYISQKYLIFRFITETCEEISDNIEINLNRLIENLVEKNSLNIFEKIFNKKFDDFDNKINGYRMNNKIYNNPVNSLNATAFGIYSYLKDLSSAPAPIPNL